MALNKKKATRVKATEKSSREKKCTNKFIRCKPKSWGNDRFSRLVHSSILQILHSSLSFTRCIFVCSHMDSILSKMLGLIYLRVHDVFTSMASVKLTKSTLSSGYVFMCAVLCVCVCVLFFLRHSFDELCRNMVSYFFDFGKSYKSFALKWVVCVCAKHFARKSISLRNCSMGLICRLNISWTREWAFQEKFTCHLSVYIYVKNVH